MLVYVDKANAGVAKYAADVLDIEGRFGEVWLSDKAIDCADVEAEWGF